MSVILFGFKGCGKTYFGSRLAKQLGRPFIDTDDIMVRLYGKESGQWLTSRGIYQAMGEAGFRELEKRAIETLLTAEEAIIALGGGAVLNPSNVELLQKVGILIYLEAGLETIKKRDVSLLEGPIEELYHKRLPTYRAIPAGRINIDELDDLGVIAALSRLVKEQSPHGF